VGEPSDKKQKQFNWALAWDWSKSCVNKAFEADAHILYYTLALICDTIVSNLKTQHKVTTWSSPIILRLTSRPSGESSTSTMRWVTAVERFSSKIHSRTKPVRRSMPSCVHHKSLKSPPLNAQRANYLLFIISRSSCLILIERRQNVLNLKVVSRSRRESREEIE
jgi:hypothetical protein